MPDFTFIHFEGPQGAHVTTVTTPTNLDGLIRPSEGAIWIAACATVFAPEGQVQTRHSRNSQSTRPGTTRRREQPQRPSATAPACCQPR